MKMMPPSLLLLLSGISLVNSIPSPKKGIGLPSSTGYGDDQLTALEVSWFFSWSSMPKIDYTVDVEFVPMIWGAGSVNKEIGGRTATGKVVLGFNEPDHENQANVAVADALAVWDQVVAKVSNYSDGLVGSPGTAQNCTNDGNWLPEFMASVPTPRVDFIRVHWYKGANAPKFIGDITNVINKYGKPVWITEFAPQTVSQASSEPNKYSQEEVNSFIEEVVEWMEGEDMVHRYAWHDAKSGTSWLYTADGSLSATGQVYAAAGRQSVAPTPAPTDPTSSPTESPTLRPTLSVAPISAAIPEPTPAPTPAPSPPSKPTIKSIIKKMKASVLTLFRSWFYITPIVNY